jgi:UDP-N-acetylmuramoyl-tripeptide--D-alanyl-D-alanine ligase
MDLDTTWGTVASATGGALRLGGPEAPFRRLQTDSRRIVAAPAPPQAFWTLRGERHDAHDFLDARLAAAADGWVVRRGARLPAAQPRRLIEVEDTAAALAALAAHHRRRFSLPIVAVTGTNGKTTVKDMLRCILCVRGPVCATTGNLNNELGLPLSLLELEARHSFGVFEMGASREGDIRHLSKIAGPTAAVLTNIGPAHLESFGSLDAVFRTKSELVDALPPGAPVALNRDDPWLARLLPSLGRRAVTFGCERGADVLALGGPGVLLEMRGRRIRVPMEGAGPIHRIDAAAAAAAAAALDFSPEEVAQGLADFRPSPLRFALRRHASGATLIVDAYNANPASMRAGVETFLEIAQARRRLLVLGDMKELGPQSRRLHRELGQWLSTLPVCAVFLAGSETESTAEALRGAAAGFPCIHEREPLALAGPVREHLAADAAVYFKASRAMRLEELVEVL